jgi:pyrimidine-nucleoside phosphorylase
VNFVEAIVKKREGGALDRDQIERFVRGAASGDLPPEQLAAMLMAICLRGMDDGETSTLTRAMLHSGETWDVAADRPDVVDKHSTGGVGDTVSLVLAPLLASVGIPVAMMAGRGLGHSQGTLDKLEAISGFDCQRSRPDTVALIDRCGAAMIAQSERIVPADRALYALRDVTGTVPSLPLIVASIMSKKLALGAAKLVLDVKWGRGAFRTSIAEAVELAAALRDVARGMGVAAEAILTDMNQPLAGALGTACEVRAARAVLSGAGSPALREVTLGLARAVLGLRDQDERLTPAVLESALDDGSAMAAWDRIVEAHGGDPDPDRLAAPSATRSVDAKRAGWIVAIAADQLGWIAVDLGAGRRSRDEEIDHGSGLEVHCRIGDRIEVGQELATVLLGTRAADVELVETRVRDAFLIGDEPVMPPKLILGTVEDIGES